MPQPQCDKNTFVNDLEGFPCLKEFMGHLSLEQVSNIDSDVAMQYLSPGAKMDYLLFIKEILTPLQERESWLAASGTTSPSRREPLVVPGTVASKSVQVAYGRGAVAGQNVAEMRRDLIPLVDSVQKKSAEVDVLDLSECFLFDNDLENVLQAVHVWKPRYVRLRRTRFTARLDKRVLREILEAVEVVDLTGTTFATSESVEYFSTEVTALLCKLVIVREPHLESNAWHILFRKSSNLQQRQQAVQQAHRKYYDDFALYDISVHSQV